MLLARAEIAPGLVRDLRIGGGVVREIGEHLRAARDEDVIDAGGAAVVPGLHDHHIHLRSAAAASASLELTAVTDASELRTAMQEAAERLPPQQWLRVIGYHDAIAGPLDRTALDALSPPGRAVRVQHRSGILWVLNSKAMERAGFSAADGGVDLDAGHLWRRNDLLRRISVLEPAALADIGVRAARHGITGFTDATPHGSVDDADELAQSLRAAGVMQNLYVMGPVGSSAPTVERATLGPVKVILDDDALPSFGELVRLIRSAHTDGRAVAIHCVTRVQLVLAVAALRDAGSRPGDRVEHASVTPADLIGDLVVLGVTVVTQPHFVAERGDQYLREVDAEDQTSLYRLRSLREAGVPLAAGSDAPFGELDPWISIAAAIHRRTRQGERLGADEAVNLEHAVALFLGPPDAPGAPRRIDVGMTADLCVLRTPWIELEDALADGPVRCTLLGGEPIHGG